MNLNEYRTGVRRGLPVGMGYFSVSFGFGAMAVSQGLRVFDATLISLTNVTSAGQFAGLTVIVAMATLWELILTQLIINSRYALMSLALSQRMGQRIGFLPRLVIAFFNTDEIFALAMAREVPQTVPFMLGLGTLPILGWTLGTLCGALAGCSVIGISCTDSAACSAGISPSAGTRRSVFAHEVTSSASAASGDNPVDNGSYSAAYADSSCLRASASLDTFGSAGFLGAFCGGGSSRAK